MILRSIAPYMAILSLATQSLRWHQTMTAELFEMSQCAARAALLQAQSVSDAAQSAKAASTSAAETSQAEALEADAQLLQSQALGDAALAAGDETAAAGLTAEAELEQSLADAAWEDAAADEIAAEAEEAEAAAALAEAAAEIEAEELADAGAIAACEFVPLVDVVCDIVGAAVGVVGPGGIETGAAEAAGADAVLAAEAHEAAGVAAAEASQAESLVAADTAEAEELMAEAQEEEVKSQIEAGRAKQEEAEAAVLETQADEQAAEAAAESAKADAEETGSADSLAKSLQHGVGAMWRAAGAFVLSVVAVLFFGIKLFGRIAGIAANAVSSSSRPSFGSKTSSPSSTSRTKILPQRHRFQYSVFNTSFTGRDITYTLLHGWVFFATVLTFLKRLALMHQCNVRSRGGLIFLFSVTAASAQSIGLHVLPDLYEFVAGRHPDMMDPMMALSATINTALRVVLSILITFGRTFMYFVPLFVLESLTCWINGGYWVVCSVLGTSAMIPDVATILLWIIYGLLCYAHHTIWQSQELIIVQQERRSCNHSHIAVADGSLDVAGAVSDAASDAVDDAVDELTRLLKGGADDTSPCTSDAFSNGPSLETVSIEDHSSASSKATPHSSTMSTSTTYYCRRTTFSSNWSRLVWPLEFLMVSCMVVVLWSCAAKSGPIWSIARSYFSSKQ